MQTTAPALACAYLCHPSAACLHPSRPLAAPDHPRRSPAAPFSPPGCEQPAQTAAVWDCKMAPTCSGGTDVVLYGWGKNAPAIVLPQGVGYSVGPGTGIRTLVLQVGAGSGGRPRCLGSTTGLRWRRGAANKLATRALMRQPGYGADMPAPGCAWQPQAAPARPGVRLCPRSKQAHAAASERRNVPSCCPRAAPCLFQGALWPACTPSAPVWLPPLYPCRCTT